MHIKRMPELGEKFYSSVVKMLMKQLINVNNKKMLKASNVELH